MEIQVKTTGYIYLSFYFKQSHRPRKGSMALTGREEKIDCFPIGCWKSIAVTGKMIARVQVTQRISPSETQQPPGITASHCHV